MDFADITSAMVFGGFWNELNKLTNIPRHYLNRWRPGVFPGVAQEVQLQQPRTHSG
jgi:hypothetical protein